MRYIQNNIPSPSKVYSFSLKDFTGGLNNRDHIPNENQCTDVMNMAFTKDGVMEKRKGTKPYDNLVLDKPITFIDEYKPHNEPSVMVRATDNKVYLGSTLLRTNVGKMSGLNHEGRYFFSDTSGLYVYGRFNQTAGTYVKHHGTSTNNYLLMQVVNPPSGFTPLDATHVEGVLNIDYTNRKVWYEPCKNEIEDTFKGANVIPTKPRFMVGREGRMYLAGSDDADDTIYITDTGNPFYFPVTLSVQLPPNSDRVTGLAVFNDSIIVGRRLDVHVLTGDTNRTNLGLPVYRLKRLNTHTGVANQQTMVNAHNYLFFLGTDSQFYAVKHLDTNSDTLATTVISKDVNIHAHPINAVKDDIWTASAYYFDDFYYVAVGDKILIYSYLHQAWTVYNQINATSFYSIMDILFIGSKSGKILLVSDNFLDEGKPYKAYWKSKQFDMDDANYFKMFRDFFIVSKSSKDYVSRVKVHFEVDYEDSKEAYDVSTKYSTYGTAVWGDTYVNRDINYSLPFFIYKRGRTIRITFSNGEDIAKTVSTSEELPDTEMYEDMLVYVSSENKYYIFREFQWHEMDVTEYDQGMCVLQLSGEYEFKWKR